MAKQMVVRLAPVSNVPMFVDANSLNNGRLKAIFSDRSGETEIGIDYFRASAPVDIGIAHKIVQEYAKQHNLPAEEFLVRARLPKTNLKARKLNDTTATNLTLVKNEEKAAENKEPVAGNNLPAIAQAMIDAHNKRKDDVKPEVKQEGKKASAEKPEGASATNPEGATVKRTEAEKKPRRKYTKQDKERSARSKAAYERYVKELSANASAASPTFMEPVQPGPGVTPEDVDEATLQFALKLAKLLKGVM
jgi:hypothetical protein